MTAREVKGHRDSLANINCCASTAAAAAAVTTTCVFLGDVGQAGRQAGVAVLLTVPRRRLCLACWTASAPAGQSGDGGPVLKSSTGLWTLWRQTDFGTRLQAI